MSKDTIPTIDPQLTGKACWHFTCDNNAITHDVTIVGGVMFYAPVCWYHKQNPCKGKLGMFTLDEMKILKPMLRLIRYLGKRKQKRRNRGK